ncbi:hypothetical protein JYT36_00425, partial [Bacteroidales bacterium AH-315-N07]|nr:hypothetical protein [Bacteroidales bacterium AH-315-N07]
VADRRNAALIMKSIFIVCLIICCMSFSYTFALDKQMFVINENEFYKSIHELSEVENYVKEHPDFINEDISPPLNDLTGKTIDLSPLIVQYEERQFDFGSYIAGLCCGVPGIAMVYLYQEHDRNAMRSSVYGYLTQQVLWITLYSIYIAIFYAALYN